MSDNKSKDSFITDKKIMNDHEKDDIDKIDFEEQKLDRFPTINQSIVDTSTFESPAFNSLTPFHE